MTSIALAYPSPENNYHEALVVAAFAVLKKQGGPDLRMQWRLSENEIGRQVFEHPTNYLLMADGSADALLTYVNANAMKSWNGRWSDLIGMPSRRTALKENQASRETFLSDMKQKGFVTGYSGDRISLDGQQAFRICDVSVWQLEPENPARGFAAAFPYITILPAPMDVR